MSDADLSHDGIAEAVIGMIAQSKQVDPAGVTAETSFDALEMDSLDKINLTFEIEERYGITIPDDAVNSLRTVGDVVAGVERLLAAKQAEAGA